jgi:hypothetical protein
MQIFADLNWIGGVVISMSCHCQILIFESNQTNLRGGEMATTSSGVVYRLDVCVSRLFLEGTHGSEAVTNLTC